MIFIQVIVNAILLGAIYTAVALGFSLVWGVMNLINLCHGSMIMLGAYITFWSFQLYGIDPFYSIPISMLALFVIGYILQKYAINFVVRAPIFMTLVLTFGLDMLIVNIALILWTGNYRSVTTSYSGASLAIGSIVVPTIRLIIFFIAIILTTLLFLFMAKTRTGNAIRATRMDIEAAKLSGIRIDRIYAITYGIGAAIAGGAGALISMTYAISPIMGGSYLGKAFVICALGGLGNLAATMVGGLILAFLENIGAVILGPGYQDAIGLGLLVLILIIRPQGILGKEYY